MRGAGALLVLSTGCMPPSVKSVDDWLTEYAAGDVGKTVAQTWSGDRALVQAALEEQAKDPNGPLALLLPPKPISHEISDLLAKESDDRHVVLAMVTMKNPLPFASERVGGSLPNIPRTRTEARRFLAVREGERWGVKLDLARVKARADFAEQVLDALSRRQLDTARALLEHVPPPPDDPNALTTRDRMVDELTKALEKKSRTSTGAAEGAQSGSPESPSLR